MFRINLTIGKSTSWWTSKSNFNGEPSRAHDAAPFGEGTDHYLKGNDVSANDERAHPYGDGTRVCLEVIPTIPTV